MSFFLIINKLKVRRKLIAVGESWSYWELWKSNKSVVRYPWEQGLPQKAVVTTNQKTGGLISPSTEHEQDMVTTLNLNKGKTIILVLNKAPLTNDTEIPVM